MSRGRKLVASVAVVASAYFSFILVGGWLASGCVEDRVESRLAAALAADVEVGNASVFIASGRVTLWDVTIKRKGVDISVERIDVKMAGGGLMLLSSRIDRVVVASSRAALSARGVISLASRKRVPLLIDSLEIRDATLSLSPTLLLPGLGRTELRIESARARDFNLATVLSWISKLDEMVATADLPAGAGVGIKFRDGELGLSGTFFGSEGLELPFSLPEFGPELLELDQLRVLGKALVKQIGGQVAKHVAKDKLWNAAKDLFD